MAFRALCLSRSRTCGRLTRFRAPIPQRMLSIDVSSTSLPPQADHKLESTTSGESLGTSGFSKAEWDNLKNQFDFPSSTEKTQDLRVDLEADGSHVTIHGFIQARKDISTKRTFVDIKGSRSSRHYQLMSEWSDQDTPEHKLHKHLKSIPAYSPVAVSGKVLENSLNDPTAKFPKVLIEPHEIRLLNDFPKDIQVKPGTVYPPSARHLQLRFDEVLAARIKFRARVVVLARRFLVKRLTEVETPLLFKSTPEGAREFLVPTRRKGKAYALPQSPQQFKQILMCAGLGGYFQFARCFRDEDLRADRQPEFTQLDLEMSFAKGEDVMQLVERLIKRLMGEIGIRYERRIVDGQAVPFPHDYRQNFEVQKEMRNALKYQHLRKEPFKRISYHEAMSLYGSDKPDLRIPNTIQRIDQILPPDAISKISSLDSPVIDACRFRLEGNQATITSFVNTFCSTLDANLPAAIANNPDGLPAILPYSPTKPLGGLSFLGHEAAETLTSENSSLTHLTPLEPGDVLILQARPDRPFTGGSTALGTIRTEFYRQAVAAGLLPRDDSFRFLWVTGFPMFTATDPTSVDPGQGGSQGFSSTHHPFTAPLSPEDMDLLQTDPLAARADHYDLVVNGVELGGGSRRIHNATLQRYVFEKILGMDAERVRQFKHLLEALRAGCPPHAGFALGFDRLVAVLAGTGSVRDVIAFPKNMKGEDMSVGSPGKVDRGTLGIYGLDFRKKEEGVYD